MTQINTKQNILKKSNLEKKQATFLVLSPEEVDHHGDIYSEEEVEKACHNFNQHCNRANLFHLMETTSFSIVESYIIPSEIEIEGVEIKKGSWLCVLKFHDDTVWQDVVDGNFTGVSVGCSAHVEEVL